ncbi:unnamed protein product [Spirodela intermedia]|uniref:Glyceraldehyde 3-phosphate dehydrogenase NAD(P) binding domain-containing protein n=1 Tax=Spirodela intermedia TaxID=51605 RepID=A0A7I8IP10_SPIIN|nr:unnamed protein product [Spirodela intermedia]CAA6659696.1 unnamed protein product [Spirodela intermedia]
MRILLAGIQRSNESDFFSSQNLFLNFKSVSFHWISPFSACKSSKSSTGGRSNLLIDYFSSSCEWRQLAEAKIRWSSTVGTDRVELPTALAHGSPLYVIAINDTGGVKQALHLLKYDSTIGIIVVVDGDGAAAISVDGKVIQVVSCHNPRNLPWKGRREAHRSWGEEGAHHRPEKGNIPTYVVGANDDGYNPDEPIISNASCTINCLAPFVKVLDRRIITGTMTTTHSYTGDQRLLDASHRDLQRARAAALNILNGIALRVPTPNVSVVDLVVQVSKKTFAEEVSAAFRESAEKELNGILSVCDEPLVSVDFRCSDVSSTVGSSLTMVMGDDMVMVIAWYDNEWGYSQRVVDLAGIVAKKCK